MVNFTCNSTASNELVNETPLWNGYTFHHLGIILSAVFGLFATLLSFYLIMMHATHYLKPWEQKHVIRILFMIPVYSIASVLSFYFYTHYIYYLVLQTCYEAFAIASFFTLVCHFIAPDLHSQKDYFRSVRPRDWIWPLTWFTPCTGGKQRGIFRTPRSGLTWFNIIWFCVFQYCFIRVFMTLVAVVTQVFGRYCIDSLSPIFAHIWVTVVEGVSVSVAMYCIIQFYIQVREDTSEHSVFLKVLAIKLVIFLSFWQTLILDLLSSAGAIKSSPQIADPDIKVGIPTMILCIEMAIFSILHVFAYPWKPYDVKRSHIVAAETNPSFQADPKTVYKGGRFGYKALLDAANPWDLIKAVGRAFRWISVGRKHREEDISYKGNNYESTALADTVGKKPGRYYPLSDEDDAGGAYSTPYKADPSPYDADGGGQPSRIQNTAYGVQDHPSASGAQEPFEEDGGFQSAPVASRPEPRNTAYQGVGGEEEMPSPTKWTQGR